MEIPKAIGLRKSEEHVAILLKSYARFFDEPFLSNADDSSLAMRELWNADFVVVSHGIEADPIFNFGNKAALNLFEFDFFQFT